jgi:elongation factor Ts
VIVRRGHGPGSPDFKEKDQLMAYTATDVKNLRERTGAGMMDCKKALDETNGDMEAAVDCCAPRALPPPPRSRAAPRPKAWSAWPFRAPGVAVEVNSETDFVAKNDQFQDFVRKVTEVALGAARTMSRRSRPRPIPGGGTVGDKLTNNVATIGENQQMRRMKTVSVSNGVVVPYMHNAAAPNLGKIGVLVALESSRRPTSSKLGKQIAMHIAAAFPMALTADDLDAEVIERERKIAPKRRRKRQAGRSPGQDGRWRGRQVRQGERAAQPGVRDGQQDPGCPGRRAGRQGRRRQDRAQGLCPLPAWRRHREGRKRLRGGSRGGAGLG